METDHEKITCLNCDVLLELRQTVFNYLGHQFKHNVLRCPLCGQVFIPEKLAKGRMSEVETMLEDK